MCREKLVRAARDEQAELIVNLRQHYKRWTGARSGCAPRVKNTTCPNVTEGEILSTAGAIIITSSRATTYLVEQRCCRTYEAT